MCYTVVRAKSVINLDHHRNGKRRAITSKPNEWEKPIFSIIQYDKYSTLKPISNVKIIWKISIVFRLLSINVKYHI